MVEGRGGGGGGRTVIVKHLSGSQLQRLGPTGDLRQHLQDAQPSYMLLITQKGPDWIGEREIVGLTGFQSMPGFKPMTTGVNMLYDRGISANSVVPSPKSASAGACTKRIPPAFDLSWLRIKQNNNNKKIPIVLQDNFGTSEGMFP